MRYKLNIENFSEHINFLILCLNTLQIVVLKCRNSIILFSKSEGIDIWHWHWICGSNVANKLRDWDSKERSNIIIRLDINPPCSWFSSWCEKLIYSNISKVAILLKRCHQKVPKTNYTILVTLEHKMSSQSSKK